MKISASQSFPRKTSLITVLVLTGLTVLWPCTAAADLERMGERQFTCAKGDVRLQGSGSSKLYPSGKHEKVWVAAKTGILRYTCKSIRFVVDCPIGTTRISVERTYNPKKFKAECFGELVIAPPLSTE